VKQLAMILVDPDGNLIYQTDEDLANLAEMPATVSTRIFKAFNTLSGISEDAKDEIVKN
jgi:sensor domain CHASE-containing protein